MSGSKKKAKKGDYSDRIQRIVSVRSESDLDQIRAAQKNLDELAARGINPVRYEITSQFQQRLVEKAPR